VVVGPELEDQGEDGELELDLDPSSFDAGKEEPGPELKVVALDHYRGPRNAKRKKPRPGPRRSAESPLDAFFGGFMGGMLGRMAGSLFDDMAPRKADGPPSKPNSTPRRPFSTPNSTLRAITTPCCGKPIVGREGDPGWPIAMNWHNGVVCCHACGAIYVPGAAGSTGPHELWIKHGGGMR